MKQVITEYIPRKRSYQERRPDVTSLHVPSTHTRFQQIFDCIKSTQLIPTQQCHGKDLLCILFCEKNIELLSQDTKIAFLLKKKS